MNFKLNKGNNIPPPPPREEPILDMKKFARDLDEGTSPPNLGHLKYAPPSARNAQTETPVSSSYADVLEQVRALSVKAIDTYGNKVTEEVEEAVREHLETALKLDARKKEIKDHYLSEMNALKKDAHDFTAHARNDLERLAGVTPVAVKFESPASPGETATPEDELGAGDK